MVFSGSPKFSGTNLFDTAPASQAIKRDGIKHMTRMSKRDYNEDEEDGGNYVIRVMRSRGAGKKNKLRLMKEKGGVDGRFVKRNEGKGDKYVRMMRKVKDTFSMVAIGDMDGEIKRVEGGIWSNQNLILRPMKKEAEDGFSRGMLTRVG